MKFEKTYGDIKLLNNLPSESFGLDKMLKLMQDIMLDVQEETRKEFMDLPWDDDNIISPWINVAGVLMNISFEDITANLSGRRREKISNLKKANEEKLNYLEKAKSEIEKLDEKKRELKEEERELNQKIADLENDKRKIQEAEKYVTALQEKREKLQAQIDEINTCNIPEFEKKVKEKESELQKKELELQEKNEENDCVRDKISEIENKIKTAKAEFENLEQIQMQKDKDLKDCNENYVRARAKLEETEKICTNKEIETDKLNKEIKDNELKAEKLESDYIEALRNNTYAKEKLKQKKIDLNSLSDVIQKSNQELEDINNKISYVERNLKEIDLQKYEREREYNALINKYKECMKNKKVYEDFFNSPDCEKTEKEIVNCERFLELYREGIWQLFKQDSAIEYLPELSEQLRQKEKVLTDQLETAKNILCNLQNDYIVIIKQIESEVN